MIAALAAGWLVGMLATLAGLALLGWMRPTSERVLSVLALVVWVIACVVLAMVLAAWWLPAT